MMPLAIEPAMPSALTNSSWDKRTAVATPADREAEQRITEMLRTALRDLSRVDYRGLTRGGREQYDQAKGFTEEADKALKERNFIYAQTVADKAAKIASELVR